MQTRRRFLGAAALGLLGGALPMVSRAQALDTAKIIVGFPPGGTTDVMARKVADALRGVYARTVLVENKPGAGGQIGVVALKDAAPDGATMLLTPSSMLSIYPNTYKKLQYKLEDVAPVSLAMYTHHVISVGPAVPDSVKSLQEFIAWAKANPDKAAYGSPGAGSMPHLVGVLLAKAGGVDLRHIAYRGSAPGIQDLLGGQIASFLGPVGDVLAHARTGKVRVLGASGKERDAFLPNVPTLREQRVNVAVREWYAFFMPARAGAETVQRASSALQKVLAQAEVAEFARQFGLEVGHSTPRELAELLKADVAEWGGLVKETGFTADSVNQRLETRRTRSVRLAAPAVVAEHRADGAVCLRSPHPLPAYPRKLTERLDHWADNDPGRLFLAQRGPDGAWQRLTYAQARSRARRVAQALIDRRLSADRPIVVLSGNDFEHALIELGALYAGVPYAPVSPSYSLLSKDFAKLKYVVRLLTPGLVFAAQRGPFQAAIADAVPAGVEILYGDEFHKLEANAPTGAVDDAHAAVGPDTVAKFLFTSGSTGEPKAVINTQRMWCSNQEMIRCMFAFFEEEPPIIVDWAPWHHTAAGNHDFGLVIYNGGSYYIDEGKPMPGAIETTVRNLREIAPTWYFNVPKGYEALLPYLKSDAVLRQNFFSRLKLLWFAGAGVSQPVFDEVRALAYQTCGEEILFLTGLGSTETAPFAMGRMREAQDVSNVGLPPPGVEIKLVPAQDKLEARLKGPNITPGYWRQPELTAQAFDEEGYYRLGDSFVFADGKKPEDGLLFRGRLSEDFKLATGTWVHVGPLRARFLEHFAPLARDVVIAGEGRSELAALVFPSAEFSREDFDALFKRFGSTGSSNRIARVLVLEEPPSPEAGEVTDKGSINQRAVLARRAALVEALYAS